LFSFVFLLNFQSFDHYVYAFPPSNASKTETSSVYKNTTIYQFIKYWGSEGIADGQFNYPNDISVDSSKGNVYVADTNNNRIQKFDSNGNFITKWGSYGSEDRQFSSPGNTAIDSLDNVYVADSYNDRIQVFAPTK
jgi:tripartite motif-containing protein 71